RYYECKYCPDCFCRQYQNRNSAQNSIDLITLAQNDTVNQCFDCFTALNELENTSMILGNIAIL
ncbi:MAG: hypothetical protein LBV16_08310, partial [Elusimicrobiota bacterium]|nr:hypothetical protein [Elusimicrobiota bacterium]